MVIGKLDTENRQDLPQLVCVGPAQIPNEWILTARRLSRTSLETHEPQRVTSQDLHSTTETRDGCVFIMVANFTNEQLTISKATVLGVAEEMTDELVNKINAGDKTASSLTINQPHRKRNEALYRKVLRGNWITYQRKKILIRITD